MIKLAIIGLGAVSRYQMDALSYSADIVLTEACDRDLSVASVLPESVRFFSSLQVLTDESEADLFLISTPSSTHFSIAVRLIEMGKDVIIEKPVCGSVAELEQLRCLASAKDCFVYSSFHAAFGAEIQWWKDNSEKITDLGQLTGFSSGFFDPYIEDGRILPAGKSLEGSWTDSGINSLSVISTLLDINKLYLAESRITYLGSKSVQAQANARLQYRDRGMIRNGTIDTNWTLGVNRKTTHLWYESAEIVLHHSLESVFRVCDGEVSLLAELANERPRLTNHYISVFEDVVRAYKERAGNLDTACALHTLYFEVMKKADRYPEF